MAATATIYTTGNALNHGQEVGAIVYEGTPDAGQVYVFTEPNKKVPVGGGGTYAEIKGTSDYIGSTEAQITNLNTKTSSDSAMIASNNVITITKAGYYVVNASVRWMQPGSATGERQLTITKSGVFIQNAKSRTGIYASEDSYQSATGYVYANAGDYFAAYARVVGDSLTRNCHCVLSVAKVG